MQFPKRLWIILAGVWLVLSAAASWFLVELAVGVVTVVTPGVCAVGGTKAAVHCAEAVRAQHDAMMWDAFWQGPVYWIFGPMLALLLLGTIIATVKARNAAAAPA